MNIVLSVLTINVTNLAYLSELHNRESHQLFLYKALQYHELLALSHLLLQLSLEAL